MFRHIIIFSMPTRWPKPLYMYVENFTEISEPLPQEGCHSFIQYIAIDCLIGTRRQSLKENGRCKNASLEGKGETMYINSN